MDVTRLISRSWTGRQSTGIDRVCYAYLRHFRSRALAVVQHRGVARTFGPQRSDQLFSMLLDPARDFRKKFLLWAPRALLPSQTQMELAGMPYINVSHTDFDLTRHFEWAARAQLRCIYFIHDLIPIRAPQFSRPHAIKRHFGRVRGALTHADTIVVSSQVVASDLAAFAVEESLRVPPILVAPIAGEHFQKTTPFQKSVAEHSRPYFLCAGTIEPRKNHRLLIDTWRLLVKRLGDQAPLLIIAGQTGPLSRNILAELRSAPEIAPFVETRTRCGDHEFGDLMSEATALLMPSQAEGYGLPVAEALALGTRVLASDTAIFREIGQGLPQFLPSDDADAWAKAIASLAVPTATAAEQAQNKAQRKAERAARFSAPTWAAHFSAFDAFIAPAALKTASAYESSVAA